MQTCKPRSRSNPLDFVILCDSESVSHPFLFLKVLVQCVRKYSSDFKHLLQTNDSIFLLNFFCIWKMNVWPFILWFDGYNPMSGYQMVNENVNIQVLQKVLKLNELNIAKRTTTFKQLLIKKGNSFLFSTIVSNKVS